MLHPISHLSTDGYLQRAERWVMWLVTYTQRVRLQELTLVLVLMGCGLSFPSLLFDILRNCLRSPWKTREKSQHHRHTLAHYKRAVHWYTFTIWFRLTSLQFDSALDLFGYVSCSVLSVMSISLNESCTIQEACQSLHYSNITCYNCQMILIQAFILLKVIK